MKVKSAFVARFAPPFTDSERGQIRVQLNRLYEWLAKGQLAYPKDAKKIVQLVYKLENGTLIKSSDYMLAHKMYRDHQIKRKSK